MSGTVLVVEDDAPVREALGQTLELAGFEPALAASFVVAKDRITASFDGVILSDIRMPGRDGHHLLDYTRRIDPDLPVILLTGEGDIAMAVSAMAKGAFDFLEKPCSNDVLISAVARAMNARGLVIENRRLKSQIVGGDAAARMIYGISEKAETLRGQVRRVAGVETPVLIEGAPGTGIAKVAEVIHRLSAKPPADLVRTSSVSLSRDGLGDLLGRASTGTVFLDEVVRLPGETQFALLEHLESGGSPRIIAGTSGDLPFALDQGMFNADLYYHLQALKITVPALAERSEDIPAIFCHYVADIAAKANLDEPDIPAGFLADLMARDWPGNTRALMNEATRFVLGLDSTPDAAPLGLVEKLNQVERALLIDALTRLGGNASAAAADLKLPRKTFYDKLARHGIKPENYR